MVDKDDELDQVSAQIVITDKERHHHLVEMEEKLQQLKEENELLQVGTQFSEVYAEHPIIITASLLQVH